ncbi:hypothetical protein NKR19_g9669 [Coniochaeta hoffmannii]|uniref:Uncharacterized protein n=1 Tax=Coniochaeta hoffmannii TaxID=91930 RepID=A0AA38RG23_9PEZI|nr:hypothetical protein NKR19_g9669 [Coniochaeta hoffmannii]
MGSFIAKEANEALAHGHTDLKPSSRNAGTHKPTSPTASTTTTKPAEGTDASASASEEDKKKKKKPGLTDEEIEQIRALSNPYS